MKNRKTKLVLLVFFAASFLLTACGSADRPSGDGTLKIVATTTIVGDVVAQIGGDLIDLSVLLPVGTDPHSFTPTPQDVAKLSDADLIFANGAGLESFLTPLIESAGAAERVVYLSDPLELLKSSAADEHDSTLGDPHTWTDPKNVMVWVQTIADELSRLGPAGAEKFQANAATYTLELQALDDWIRQQVAQIPEARRQIVTDHLLFGYYVAAYGFKQVGAVVPGYSTLSEPSAQELAALEDAIKSLNVPAIFVGNTVNPSLSERVAGDTGMKLVYVYTGSLSDPGGEAATYLDYMRYNTRAFVEALTPTP